MLGLCLSLPEAARRIPGAAAPLPAAIHTIVIEGDSITSGMPGTPNGFYSYQYGDYRADKTIEVRAQGSRAVGAPAELNDDGNTLIGNVTEDVAYGPQLITAMIGTNDFTLGTDATYRGNLIGYFAALKAASPGVKFAWAGPIAPNPTGTPHPQKANIDAQRATLFASGSTGARNPAVGANGPISTCRWANIPTSAIHPWPRRCSATASIPAGRARPCSTIPSGRRWTRCWTPPVPVPRHPMRRSGPRTRPASPPQPKSCAASSCRAWPTPAPAWASAYRAAVR